ncbi:MAG TPA: AfsR/SARP family transcriptional regulator [Pseudonocardiaceae bacterium]|jgi:DNA-binding SARP family transcriptional activator|nr:AfsR/SARP family transcriptional regulator [Pseudonocardiaceae bacterium]
MTYQILGALRVAKDGDVATVGARKVNALLAVLLIRANQVVSAEALSQELWGDNPPRRATAGLHVYVSQLRKFLADTVSRPNPLVTRAPGYLIQVGTDELDLLVFRRLVHEGRTHMRARRYDEASRAFGSALDLWRGPVLDDLQDGEIVRRFVTWVEELRLECTEMLVEADLALGRHRELVGFLHGLVSEYPLHEAFYRQLMLVLYRCERRAEALRAYHIARETLTTELGLEPGRPLRELHHAILLDEDERLAV